MLLPEFPVPLLDGGEVRQGAERLEMAARKGLSGYSGGAAAYPRGRGGSGPIETGYGFDECPLVFRLQFGVDRQRQDFAGCAL